MSVKKAFVLKEFQRGIRIILGDDKWIDLSMDSFCDLDILASGSVTLHPYTGDSFKLNVREN